MTPIEDVGVESVDGILRDIQKMKMIDIRTAGTGVHNLDDVHSEEEGSETAELTPSAMSKYEFIAQDGDGGYDVTDTKLQTSNEMEVGVEQSGDSASTSGSTSSRSGPSRSADITPSDGSRGDSAGRHPGDTLDIEDLDDLPELEEESKWQNEEETTFCTETSMDERGAFVHRVDINAKDDQFHDRMKTNPFVRSDAGSRSPSTRSNSKSHSGSNLIKRFLVNRKFHPRSARHGTVGTLCTVETAGTVDSDDTFLNRMDTLPYHYDFVEPDTITEECFAELKEDEHVTGIEALAAEFVAESYVDKISMNDPTRTAMSFGEF